MRHDCKSCCHAPPKLWAENMPVLRFWPNVCTQWRAGGFSVVGMDWPAVLQVADFLGVQLTRHDFAKLRHIESMELQRLSKGKDSEEE